MSLPSTERATDMATPAVKADELRQLGQNQLARMAGCGDPDTADSAGSRFLFSVRDAVADAIDNDEMDEDTAHEIADSAPDVYTHQRWLEFVDLAAYQEDVSEYGPTDDDLTRLAGVALYAIAERLVAALVEEVDQ